MKTTTEENQTGKTEETQKDKNENTGESLSFKNGQIFRSYIQDVVHEVFKEIVHDEIRGLCGEAWHPDEQKDCYRAGSTPSSIFLQGKKVSLTRPRVRRKVGEGSTEVILNTWEMAQDPAEWEDTMMKAILAGVAMRKVKQLRPEEVAGESKSSISRLWQYRAGDLVKEMQHSDLSGYNLLVLMIDAVVLCKGLVATVALGIDTEGNKRVLGYQIGSSENVEVCRDLLSGLKRRGLKVSKKRRLLVVLDGSKALKKALLEIFPKALIQRCLVHKERNLRGYLSKKHWGTLAALFQRLRLAQGLEDALEASNAIEEFLSNKNAQARESFAEAGGELIALFTLNVPNTLNVSLLSTNCIENAFKNLRRHIGRVCRWRKETRQADLWVASGLTLAQQGFRKISGSKDLHTLVKALENSK